MAEYKELYQELDKAVEVYLSNSGLAKQPVAMGENFKNDDINLLVVGRCLNGWDTPKKRYEKGIPAKNTEPEMILKDMFTDNAAVKNDLNNYSFWKLSKKVVEKLLKKELDKKDWYEHIAWYNLFPVAPSEGGNPSDLLVELTREAAKDLLEQVIYEVKPTHILFVTGWYYWIQYNNTKTKAVKAKFEMESISETDYLKELRRRNTEKGFMLDKLTFKTEEEVSGENVYFKGALKNPQNTKVVVCRRPERQGLDAIVDDIINVFNAL